MTGVTQGVHFITFGDGNETYRAAGQRIAVQARETGWFASVQTFHEEDLPKLSSKWFETHRDFIRANARGFGYWMWKPFIILEVLKTLPEGEILLYADAGFEISKGGAAKFRGYLDEVQRAEFLAFEITHPIHKWTKGDVFAYFSIAPNSEIYFEDQLQSGLLFFRKTAKSLLFVSHWAELMAARGYSLLDDTVSVAPNSEGFVEHRHDQAILTVLAKMHRFGSILPAEDYHADIWAAGKYIVENPFHAFRNRTGARFIND